MVLPGSNIWRPRVRLDGRLLPDRRQFPELAAASMGWRAYKKVYANSSRHAAECGFTRLQKNVAFAARVAELSEEAFCRLYEADAWPRFQDCHSARKTTPDDSS
jgi:hypothetical protein